MDAFVAALGYTVIFVVDTIAAVVTWRRRHHWARPKMGPHAGTALAFFFGVFVLPYYVLRYGVLGKH